MSVERYALDTGEMELHRNGGYVLHADYEELLAERNALAAESAELKAFGDKLDEMHNDLNGEGTGIQGRAEVACQQVALEAAMEEFDAIKTPATDAFLAEMRAQHGESICASLLEKASEYDARAKEVDCHITDNRYRFAAAMFRGFADQIRKGVQS